MAMTPEERAALEKQLYDQRVALNGIQEENRIRRLMMEKQHQNDQIRQVFSDIPANQKPRLSSSLVSDNTYSPFLSQTVGNLSVAPLLEHAKKNGQDLEAGLSQLQELYRNIPHLEKDREAVNNALKQYQISPELLEDKFAAQKVQHLATKFREDLKSTNNILGAAYQNYNIRQKFHKDLDDLVKNYGQGGGKGGITAQTAQHLKNIYDDKYSGIGGDGSPNQVFNNYQTTNAANISDKEKLVLDYVKGWQKDKDAFSKHFLSREADGRVYVRGANGSKEYVDENDIRSVLPQFLRNNQVIDEDVTQQAMIETHFQDSDSYVANRKQQVMANYEKQSDMLNKLRAKKSLTEKEKKDLAQLERSVESLYGQANYLQDALESGKTKEVHQQMRKNEIYNDLVNMAVRKEAHAQYAQGSSLEENEFDKMRMGYEREDEKNRLQQVTLMSANYQIQTGQPADLSLANLEPFKKLVPYAELKDEMQWEMGKPNMTSKDDQVKEYLAKNLGYKFERFGNTLTTPSGKKITLQEAIKTYDDLAKAAKSNDYNTQLSILAENNPFLKSITQEMKKSLGRITTDENGAVIDNGLTQSEVNKVFQNYNKMINGLSSSSIVYDSYTVGTPQYDDMQKFIKDDKSNNFTSNFWNMYVIEDGNPKKSMADYIKDKFDKTPEEFNALPAKSKEGSDEVSRQSIMDKISIGGRQFGNIVEGQYQANIDGKPVSLGFNSKAGMANELEPFDAFRRATYENKQVPVSFEQAVGIRGIKGEAKSKIVMDGDEFVKHEQVLVLDKDLPHKDKDGRSFVVVPVAWDATGKEKEFTKVYEGQEIPVDVLQNVWRMRNRTANQTGDTKRTNSGFSLSQYEETPTYYKKP